MLFLHQRAGIKTLDELRRREVTLGAQGVGNRSYLYARLIAELLALKVRWVLGYDTCSFMLPWSKEKFRDGFNDAAS